MKLSRSNVWNLNISETIDAAVETFTFYFVVFIMYAIVYKYSVQKASHSESVSSFFCSFYPSAGKRTHVEATCWGVFPFFLPCFTAGMNWKEDCTVAGKINYTIDNIYNNKHIFIQYLFYELQNIILKYDTRYFCCVVSLQNIVCKFTFI